MIYRVIGAFSVLSLMAGSYFLLDHKKNLAYIPSPTRLIEPINDPKDDYFSDSENEYFPDYEKYHLSKPKKDFMKQTTYADQKKPHMYNNPGKAVLPDETPTYTSSPTRLIKPINDSEDDYLSDFENEHWSDYEEPQMFKPEKFFMDKPTYADKMKPQMLTKPEQAPLAEFDDL